MGASQAKGPDVWWMVERFGMLFEVLSKYCPALVVFPATADFQIAARKALPDKAAFLHQPNRGTVSRLNVGFQSVELERAEGVFEHEQHPLIHQPRSQVGREAIVTKKRTLEAASNQIVEIDDSN